MSLDPPQPQSVTTQKGYPARAGTKVEDEARGEPQHVVQVKAQNIPQLASHEDKVGYVAPRRFVYPTRAPLCPSGCWKAVCGFFFFCSAVAMILFIIDIIQHK